MATAPLFAPLRVESDRPGFTDATRPAPFFGLVIEGGASLDLVEDGPTTLLFPEVMLRTGLARFLEVRARLPSFGLVFPSNRADVATDDLELGALIGGELAQSVEGSLVPTLRVPLGRHDEVGVQRVEGRLRG
ncbi:MAG: hypothetical protein H5U40_17050, partial [Polyangiaceae bacterium]|nr:hypothetical protein [Polyangiaceae bacterium]